MLQSATRTDKPAARRRTSWLLGLALILLTLALALPAGASAFSSALGRQYEAVPAPAPASDAPVARSHRAHVPKVVATRDERAGRETRDGRVTAAHVSRSPERALVRSTTSIEGVFLDFAGSPIAGAAIWLGSRDASGSIASWTKATTGSDGSFTFTGVPIANGGTLEGDYPDGSWIVRDYTTFAPGAGTYDLRPGQVPISLTRSDDPGWNTWQSTWVNALGPKGATMRKVVGTSGQVFAMEPSVDYVKVRFWTSEVAEWQSFAAPISVVAGQTSPTAISVNESDARRVWIFEPYWRSGPPGSTVKLALGNWPAGYKAKFYGYQEGPEGKRQDYTGEWTSTGQTAGMQMTVPAWATPGYAYQVHAYRSDTLWRFTNLNVHDFFLVCTLKASKTRVSPRTSLTVSGVIPTQGHWGPEAGISKPVTLYAHKGNAAVPGKWEPKSEGWTRIATFNADGFGRYKSGSFKLKRTSTLVVRFPGDDWYSGAYTATQKVSVK